MQCFLCKSNKPIRLIHSDIYVEEQYIISLYQCRDCKSEFIMKNSFVSITTPPEFQNVEISSKTLASETRTGILRGDRYCFVCKNIGVTRKRTSKSKISYGVIEEYHSCSCCKSSFKTFHEYVQNVDSEKFKQKVKSLVMSTSFPEIF